MAHQPQRGFGLWEVAPEVRWYLGKQKRGYIGAMYKAGSFNYKFTETGRQGDIMGGGLTGGYMLRLNDAFSLDFGLGIGYLRADFDEYVVIDNVTSMWSSTTCASAPARAARTGGDPSMRASPWYGHYSDRKEEKK